MAAWILIPNSASAACAVLYYQNGYHIHAGSSSAETCNGNVNDSDHTNGLEGNGEKEDLAAGADTSYAYDGPDDMDMDTGADAAHAGSGQDTVHAGDGADTVDAGDGADKIYGGAGNDELTGDNNPDEIYDSLNGEDVDNVYASCDGGANDTGSTDDGDGNDTLYLGDGDVFDFDSWDTFEDTVVRVSC